MRKKAVKSPESEWFVLRSFSSGGKTYEAGDAFPWRLVGCSERRLAQMVANRQLCSAADLPKVPATEGEEE